MTERAKQSQVISRTDRPHTGIRR